VKYVKMLKVKEVLEAPGFLQDTLGLIICPQDDRWPANHPGFVLLHLWCWFHQENPSSQEKDIQGVCLHHSSIANLARGYQKGGRYLLR